MSRTDEIQGILSKSFGLSHLEVLNESHGHNVPAGSETHFKVVLVSDDFCNTGKVQRHQKVYAVLQHLMSQGLHALSVHAYTVAEWESRQKTAPDSPSCLGGSKHDKKGNH